MATRSTAIDEYIRLEDAFRSVGRFVASGSIDGNRLRHRTGHIVAVLLAVDAALVFALLAGLGQSPIVLAATLAGAVVLSLRLVTVLEPVRLTSGGVFIGGLRNSFVPWLDIESFGIRWGQPYVTLAGGRRRGLPTLRGPIPFVSDSHCRLLIAVLCEERARSCHVLAKRAPSNDQNPEWSCNPEGLHE